MTAYYAINILNLSFKGIKMEKNPNTVIKTESTKTDVVRNELNPIQVVLGCMMQKQIVDKYSKIITEFIVLSNTLFTESIWVNKDVWLNILNALEGTTGITYRLKNRSVAEGMKKAQDGKALKIDLADKEVVISIHMQPAHVKSDDWRHTYTYRIDKKIFDAYALVIGNDVKAAKLEHDCKIKENSSLDLG